MELFTMLFLLGTAALSMAQSMPACASECLVTYLATSSCSATDFACICADANLLVNVSTCTLGSCTILESLSAKNVTSTLCGDPVRDITMVTPIVSGVSMAFAIIAVIFKLADSFARHTVLHWSNAAIVLGLLCGIVMGGLEFPMSSLGFGKDVWTIPFDHVTTIVMYTWLTEVFYMAALGFTKMSIVGFYLRVFPGATFRKICWVTIAICAAYIPAFCLTTIFHCTPVSYTWTGWSGETVGSCINFNAFAWAHAIVNIVLDFFIMALPLPQIWRLNMGRRKRILLVLMFSVGIFITVVSIVRLTALVEFATTTNATYDNVPTAYWSVLEAFVSIVCCCLPAVRSLLSNVFPSCFGSTVAGSSGPSDPTPRSWGSKGIISSSKRSKMTPKGGGIQKSLTATVTFTPRGDGASDVELVDRGLDGRWSKISD